jgi:hypothetical protein
MDPLVRSAQSCDALRALSDDAKHENNQFVELWDFLELVLFDRSAGHLH